MQPGPARLDRTDLVIAPACFAASLALYIRTLAPGLLPGDSGEFQTLATLLGHTHPTGYPVYLALAKLATFIPLGEVAYRVNLFSGIMGALAVAAVYLTGRLLVTYRLFALVGAAALAIAPTFWSQAIIAEIYSAGAAFLALILFCLLWWDRSDNPKALISAGLLGGLSLGVHMSVALLAPAVLLFLLLHWRRGMKMWVAAALGALAGLLITIVLFWLIDWNNPTANYFNTIIEPSRSAWGLSAAEINGPLERLFFGWSARQFRAYMFADILNVMPSQAKEYWANLPAELSWTLVSLSALGAVALLARRWRVGLLLLAALFVQLFWFFNYEIWDLYVFYIPSYVLLAILAAPGMGALADLGAAFIRRVTPNGQFRRLDLSMEIVIALLVLGFSAWPVFSPYQDAIIEGDVRFEFDNYPHYDERLGQATSATILDLPQNAIVFTEWFMVWPYYYSAHILGDRRDLTFIETYPADNIDGPAFSVLAYVAEKRNDHMIYFSEREPALLKAGYDFTPARIGPTRLYLVVARQ